MKLIYSLIASLVLCSVPLLAEPVDMNFGGPFLSGGLLVGQSDVAGGDVTPGQSFGLGGELGFVAKRDTWNRLEFGLDLASTALSFKSKSGPSVETDLNMKQALLKVGYGYSLGQNVFALVRGGAGLAFGDYEVSDSGSSVSSDASAVVSMLGADIVYPVSEHMEFVLGAQMRILNTSVDDIAGQSVDSFQVNQLLVLAQTRLKI